MDIVNEIVGQLYKAVNRWTEDPSLLSIIGSWRDTLSDDEILAMLKDYNASPTGEVLHPLQ